MRINAIWFVLTYYEVYGFVWAVLFSGSIIQAPVMLMRKKKIKLFVRVCACV